MRQDYEVHLKDFDGPLDLLLHLVRSARMDIADIRLAEITDQYLAWMSGVHELDMERASSFLETASVLVLIKSRALLPAPPAVSGEEEEDPEKELVRKMQLYAVFKAASRPMRSLEEEGARYFYKLPEELPENEEAEIRLFNADTAALQEAFLGLLRRRSKKKEPEPVHHVAPDAFSVSRKKKALRRRLAEGPFFFASLFDEATPLMEIVVTFMALLELWGAGDLEVMQSRPYAPIEIRPRRCA